MITEEEFETVILHAIDRIEKGLSNGLCCTLVYVLRQHKIEIFRDADNRLMYHTWILPFKPKNKKVGQYWWSLKPSGRQKRLKVLRIILENGYGKTIK